MSTEFSAPRPNLIVSSSGFSVEVLGRTGMRYSEGDRTLFVDSEVLAKPGAMALYRSSIKAWDAPHETDAITDDERSRIVENIGRAFAFKGYELEVI
jgi:Immunity protein 74